MNEYDSTWHEGEEYVRRSAVDERIGSWRTAREFADGLRDKTGQTVFFHTKDDPQHRSWLPWFMKKEIEQ